MGILITERKFYSQWRNGTTFASNTSDFTKHLKGSVGEKIKLESTVYVSQVSEFTKSNPYYVESDVNGLYTTMRRISGSWVQDGFQVGDTINEVYDYNGINSSGVASAPTVAFTGVVSSVTDLIMVLTAGIASTNAGERPNNAVIGVIRPVYLNIKFGFVENSDQTLNFNSPYSNDIQSYYYDAISGTPTTHTMLVSGGTSVNKNWESGGATVAYVSADDPLSIGTNYRFKFTVTHTFVINPFYIDEFLQNFEDNTQPDNLIGGNSIKYIAEYEFRTLATNSNTDIVGHDNFLSGNVGWFNENYNGNSNIYSVSGVVYEDFTTTDAVDGLQSSSKTTVSGTITGTGFANTDKARFYFFNCTKSANYSENQGSLQDAFLYDNILATMVAGTITATGTDRIKRFKLDYVNTTTLTFEADIELTSAQKTYVDDDSYFIGIQLGNTNADDTSNKVILKVDFAPWVLNADVAGLATFVDQGILLHNQDESEAGYSNAKLWKEDGVLYKNTIVLNKTLEANLQTLDFKLVAHNTVTDDEFDIQTYSFNLNDVVLVNSTPHYQKVDLATTRNFKLAESDFFNEVGVTFNDISGTSQDVDVVIGFKFDWQSWRKLSGADTIFTDQTLDSNGLGTDASRYSDSNNYEIRCVLEAGINQYDSTISGLTSYNTIYKDSSVELFVYDYGEDASTPANWSYVIQTFDSSANNLSGAILKDADTKMKITWTPQSGSTATFSNAWAIHRIEQLNAVGYGDIDEFSSIRSSRVGNLLKPVTGQTYLKITDSGTTIVTECLIDYTKLSGTDYRLSGRLGLLKIYGRYGYAKDFKFLDSAKTEAISFSYNGFPAESNSLRHCILDSSYNVVYETAIEVDALYEYEYMKLAVDPNESANGKRVFYMIGYGASDLVIFRYVYNGTIYQKTLIHSETSTGAQPPILRIDPVLSPNSRAFIWFGNLQIDVSAGGRGLKTLYWDGASYVATDVEMYDAGTSNTPENPIDINFYDGNIFIMNYDQGTSVTTTNQERGKIGLWTQTGGSTTSPTDRSNFANYTYGYDLYLNATDHKNVNGVGNVGDMAYAWGFEISEIDSNNNPIFVSTCNANTGALGRHFVRIRANIASPTTSADWTIENPMSFIDGTVGDMVALSGTASATATSTPQNYRYSCHLAIIDGNTFIAGMDSEFHWMKYTINSWTGASNNSWYINAPFDVNYDFTDGNILTT